MKGFMIAGVSSGIGKTTISMGLMSIFNDVSPFKVGPDYIDKGFHEAVTGNKSYNLDLFMMGEEAVKYSFYKHQKNISIIEGVMGLYDGIDNSLDNYSSAHLSRVLDIPVILVVDGVGKSTSIAAQILGYKMLDERVNIAGVIINKVSSSKTYDIFKEAIEKYVGIECLGYLEKENSLTVGSRHLGLLQSEEIDDFDKIISKLKEKMKETINIKRIEEIASSTEFKEVENPFKDLKNRYENLKIAIAKDSAFSFYYNDNLELLEYMGMEIEYFSPIKDKKIPKADILYFGGGYPEHFLPELSENLTMKNSIEEFYKEGGKILAECGGFLYLSDEIITANDEAFKMCSLVGASIKMGTRLDISRFGYITILENDKVIAKAHEFHYSKISEIRNDNRKYLAKKNNGREWKCVFSDKNLYAGYPHLHFFSSIKFIEEFLKGEK